MTQAQLPEGEGQGASLDPDAALQQLVSEHHALDERVRRLSHQTHLSTEQQLAEITLKKRKLALKDRIEALARHRSQARGSA